MYTFNADTLWSVLITSGDERQIHQFQECPAGCDSKDQARYRINGSVMGYITECPCGATWSVKDWIGPEFALAV